MRSYQVDMCNGPIFKKLIIFYRSRSIYGKSSVGSSWFNKCINQFIGEYVYWY